MPQIIVEKREVDIERLATVAELVRLERVIDQLSDEELEADRLSARRADF